MSSTLDSHPRAKRPRKDEAVEVVRSKIWYPDGTVVLQAESTQFRVYGGFLAARSTVFRDMFAVGQAPSGEDCEVDGAPLVDLYDDKAADVEQLLDALYDWNFSKAPQKSFAQVSAMWRLGKKYGFDDLRNDAQQRLEACYPPTLAAYRKHQLGVKTSTLVEPVIGYVGMWVDAVKLARETGLLSILPAALYLSTNKTSQRDIHEEILHGVSAPDGQRFQLSEGDKAVCILATFELIKRQWEGPYKWVTGGWALHSAGSYKCTGNYKCREVFDTAKSCLGGLIPDVDPLGPTIRGATGLCAACLENVTAVVRKEEEKLWQDLPGIYGLPSWDEINKEMERISGPAST
ncbi:hypothetical protein FB45DRAFT_1007407 [Roridomyces roridus]|uniref:BTB domain-containing protein n=1 Tax=Roridomyces roridus TaxID=1738132 RepID=A0AAD7BEA8_9AGAR|nr:hypothetical protein FB45DRAFT_1007407 [Roridomyces roridus]